MKFKTKKELEERAAELNANAEAWESGELGESEEHARVWVKPLSFEEYCLKHQPAVVKEYQRSLMRFTDLKVGDKVLTLRAGFGGGIGALRVVTEQHFNATSIPRSTKISLYSYVTLSYIPTTSDDKSRSHKSFVLEEDKWWQAVYVFSSDEECERYNNISYNDQRQWQRDNLGTELNQY